MTVAITATLTSILSHSCSWPLEEHVWTRYLTGWFCIIKEIQFGKWDPTPTCEKLRKEKINDPQRHKLKDTKSVARVRRRSLNKSQWILKERKLISGWLSKHTSKSMMGAVWETHRIYWLSLKNRPLKNRKCKTMQMSFSSGRVLLYKWT